MSAMKQRGEQGVHDAVRQAWRRSDSLVLVGLVTGILLLLGVVVAIGYWLIATGSDLMYDEATDTLMTAGDFSATIAVYAGVLVLLLVVLLVVIRIMRQQFLGNALHVEYSDYAWLRDWSNQVAKDLQMPRVEMFVTQDPVINAFAIGFRTPYNIVLNSGSIRYLTRDELKVVVVHEMAHIKFRHTQYSAYLSVLTALPIIGEVANWLLAFWRRRTELAADRLAYFYIGDAELVKRSLIKVHVGPDVASSFNEIAREWQKRTTDSLFNHFSQTFSSHPFLVRRLQRIDSYEAAVAAKRAV